VHNAHRTEDILVQKAHNVHRNEVLLAHNAQNARMWDGTPAHVLIRVGGGDFKWSYPTPTPNLALDR
jgi:hypothetical protein